MQQLDALTQWQHEDGPGRLGCKLSVPDGLTPIVRGQCTVCGTVRNLWLKEMGSENVPCDHQARGCEGAYEIVYSGLKQLMPSDLVAHTCRCERNVMLGDGSTLHSQIKQFTKRKKKNVRPIVPVKPGAKFWVKLSSLHRCAKNIPASVCRSLFSYDNAYDEEQVEQFETWVFQAEVRCNGYLNNVLNHLIDMHAQAMGKIICRVLDNAASAIDSDSPFNSHTCWAELRVFLDEVLGDASDGVSPSLFKKVLHRVADGFARVFEAVMVGEVTLEHSLSEHVEVLQLCLTFMADYFQADGLGLSEQAVDSGLSNTSRLGNLVQYHMFDDMMLMGSISVMSGGRISAEETVQRGLMMRVLGTRESSEVHKFLLQEESKLRRELQAKAAGAPKTKQEASAGLTPYVWGTDCDLLAMLRSLRGLDGPRPRRTTDPVLAIGVDQVKAAHEATLRHCLRQYLDEGDPIERAREVADENQGPRWVRMPDEMIRHTTFVDMMDAVLSNALRPREGKYVVSAKVSYYAGEDKSSANPRVGTLQPGEALIATHVREQPDGTSFRIGFLRGAEEAVGPHEPFWATATKKRGEILVQRVAPPELTHDDCGIMKRALLPDPTVFLQKTLSRMTPPTPTPTAGSPTPTPRRATGTGSMLAMSKPQYDDMLGTVWFYAEKESRLPGHKGGEAPFTPVQCQQLERAFKSKGG